MHSKYKQISVGFSAFYAFSQKNVCMCSVFFFFLLITLIIDIFALLSFWIALVVIDIWYKCFVNSLIGKHVT